MEVMTLFRWCSLASLTLRGEDGDDPDEVSEDPLTNLSWWRWEVVLKKDDDDAWVWSRLLFFLLLQLLPKPYPTLNPNFIPPLFKEGREYLREEDITMMMVISVNTAEMPWGEGWEENAGYDLRDWKERTVHLLSPVSLLFLSRVEAGCPPSVHSDQLLKRSFVCCCLCFVVCSHLSLTSNSLRMVLSVDLFPSLISLC